MNPIPRDQGGVGASAALAAGLFGYAALFLFAVQAWRFPLPEVQSPPEPAAAALPPGPEPGIDSVPDRLGRGDALAGVLHRNGFSAADRAAANEALASVLDLRRLRTGQTLWVHRDPEGQPTRVDLEMGDWRVVSVMRTADGAWEASESQAKPVMHRELVAGTVSTSLYESMIDAGERPDLAVLIGTVLEYQLDLRRDTRRGDTWTVLVDKLRADGGTIGYGDTHAVRFLNDGEEILAFRYEFPDGSSGYYDENGRVLQRPFLASPVRYTRISSGFTSRRLHPVHRVYRPHYGVDYAAPHGRPVVATANGTVTDAGMRGPNGNMVTIRHPGGYQTKYLHLSRIPREIRPGRKVRQRDVIGYVGSTGTSTGPHVDYRLYKDGRPINPRANILPEGPPIAEEHRADFEARRDALWASLRAGSPPSTGRAAAVDAE